MSKKKPGRPPNPDRHVQPRVVFHLEQALLDALNNYCVAQKYRADRSEVIRAWIAECLRREGFWPAKEIA